MIKDFFAHKADSYEQNRSRVDNVQNIANAVIKGLELKNTMQLMDFGSGTGLLIERIAPLVSKITAVDISPAMNAQLESKRHAIGCKLEIIEIDLESTDLEQTFDGIVSSMTMHHIQDIEAMFSKFYHMVSKGGFIAIADLDKEDGSFHTEDTGVHHCGFVREELANAAKAAGFRDIALTTASVLHKPQGDFSVFLLTAYR